MSGINEWLQESEHSKYQTPRRTPWWVWLWIGLVIGFVLGHATAAHASPSCMTQAEARHAWPNKHLYWSGQHCWSDKRGHVERRHVKHVPLPQARPEAADREMHEAFKRYIEKIVPKDWTESARWEAYLDAALLGN